MREIDPVGAGTVVVASLLWAAGSVYSRYAPQPSSQALSSGMQMLGGAAALACLSLASGELAGHDWRAVSATAFGAWAYVAVLGSVAYGSYLWLLKASTPAKAATYAYVNPVIALVLGYLRRQRGAVALVDGLLGPRACGGAPGRLPLAARPGNAAGSQRQGTGFPFRMTARADGRDPRRAGRPRERCRRRPDR